MSIHLESKDLVNPQQMEVVVRGPDGATHLILCTGVAELGSVTAETYTFCVGPRLSRRQFVGAIASCAPAAVQIYENTPDQDTRKALEADFILVGADYDDETSQVKVRAQIPSSINITKLAISYNVSILAELPVR